MAKAKAKAPDSKSETAEPDDSVVDLPEAGAAATGDEAESEEPEDTTAFLKGLAEAILFVADRPLELKELARAVRIDKKRCTELLQLLREDYRARGVYVEEVAGGFAFRTNPMYADAVRKFLAQRPVRLSRAQLETLSIVAYRQPITRPEVDDIRGVDCGPVLKGLLERELIRVLGKKDEPGRPMLYGTSPQFLELFNLESLSDLPTLKEFTELSENSRLIYENELGEDAPEGPLNLEEVVPGVAGEREDEREPGDGGLVDSEEGEARRQEEDEDDVDQDEEVEDDDEDDDEE